MYAMALEIRKLLSNEAKFEKAILCLLAIVSLARSWHVFQRMRNEKKAKKAGCH